MGPTGDVWGNQAPRLRPEGMVRRKRLRFRHVESSTQDTSGFQGFSQGQAIDGISSACIDQDGVLLHQGQTLLADDVVGCRRSRQSQGHDIHIRQKLIQPVGARHVIKPVHLLVGMTADAIGRSSYGLDQSGEARSQVTRSQNECLGSPRRIDGSPGLP